jgi:hypothetical protein
VRLVRQAGGLRTLNAPTRWSNVSGVCGIIGRRRSQWQVPHPTQTSRVRGADPLTGKSPPKRQNVALLVGAEAAIFADRRVGRRKMALRSVSRAELVLVRPHKVSRDGAPAEDGRAAVSK